MQVLAVISLVATLAILFEYQARRILEIGLNLFENTRQAKLGRLKIQIDKRIEDISERIVRQSAWVQILLSQLTNDEVGLLLAIAKTERFAATDALKNTLRSLRARGLIQHDMPTMADSKEVWLTGIGQDFVRVLLEAEAKGVRSAKRRSRNSDNERNT